MKKQNAITEITLWKDNKVSGEFTMPIKEFKEKFFAWLKTKEKSWSSYYGSRTAICEFIGTELKSAADFDPKKGIDVYTDLSKLVQDEFWNIVEKEAV